MFEPHELTIPKEGLSKTVKRFLLIVAVPRAARRARVASAMARSITGTFSNYRRTYVLSKAGFISIIDETS